MAFNKTKRALIIGAAAAGIAAFGATAARAEVPQPTRESLVQQTDFRFPRSTVQGYKWGGDLTTVEEPRLTSPDCPLGCAGQPYTEILHNEEVRADNPAWNHDGGQGNVSSKALVANLNVREDDRAPQLEMTRYDGLCETKRCMYEVLDSPANIETMDIFFRRESQLSVNNLGTGTPADHRSFSIKDAGTVRVDTNDLGDTIRVTPAQRRIFDDYKFAMGFSADPKGFSYLRALDANGNSLTLERAVYKGQPEGDGFNGRKDLLGVERIITGTTLDSDGNVIASSNPYSFVHWFDVVTDAANSWYGEAFLRRTGTDGLTEKIAKIDVKGWFSGGNPHQKVAGVFNPEDYPSFCGQHAWFNYPANDSCIDDKFTVGMLGDRLCVTMEYDASNHPVHMQGRARMHPSLTEWGTRSSVTFDSDFFGPELKEIDGKVLDGQNVNGRIWLGASGVTDVGIALHYRDTVTGEVKTYTSPEGTQFQPFFDTQVGLPHPQD